MNAIDFLIKEHNNVRQIIKNIDKQSQPVAKKQMFQELCHKLIRHEKMEHQIWYPYFKDKLDDTVSHLVSEEKHAEKLARDFAKIDDQKEWEAKFDKFKHDIEHHANEEEQVLFPKVKKLLNETQLENIAKEMRSFEQDYDA